MSDASTKPGSPGQLRGAFVPSREPDIRRVAATLVSAAVVICGLYFGREILIPLAIAFLITFALNPPVTWLVRHGLPRLLATSLVMVVVVCVLAGLGIILGAQVRSIAIELPAYQSTILKKFSDLREGVRTPGFLEGALQTFQRMRKEVESTEKKPEEGPPPQRVEVVPTQQTPLEQAITWLFHLLEPLATAGIIFIFVLFALLDIGDLRDRFLRLLGGDFHRSTDAIEEAGARISKYLLMQLLVNVSYGVPLAIGLWVIGVPGAVLWGVVAAVLRFVPYLGPLIAAVFPIALAFAVDDGWSLLLWTVTLIVFLELASNNIVEPLLYGASTGLSAISLIAAAVFWTALWGPIGLLLSTPLTVCLLVLGRNLPEFQFLETMLGSTPALNTPTRIYQRLIADDTDEAIEIASAEIEKSSVVSFYDSVGVEVLRLASEEHLRNASAEHRLRLLTGMDTLLDDLRDQHPSTIESDEKPAVLCIGGKWELDALAGEMLAHALALEGIAASFRPPASVNADYLAKLDLKGADIVCLSYFTTNPVIPARHACRRLRRRWPNVRVVLALWNAPPELLTSEPLEALKIDAVATSVQEAVYRIHRLVNPEEAKAAQKASLPDNDAKRVDILTATRVLEGDKREALDALAKRAADVFNTRVAVISTIDNEREYFVGQSGKLPKAIIDDAGALLPMAREHAICNYVVSDDEALVIPDIERDPRFVDNESIKRWDVRFYAGAPLRIADGQIIGALCILDSEPRTLKEDEVALLETMAADVAATIAPNDANEVSDKPAPAASSRTIGQQVPESN
jgi:predicted PurR-regulated permease PerM